MNSSSDNVLPFTFQLSVMMAAEIIKNSTSFYEPKDGVLID